MIFILIVIVLSLILNAVLVFIILRINKKNNKNEILKEILKKINNNNEANENSVGGIVDVLRKYYRIDYCSIFEKQNDDLRLIYTDVERFYQPGLLTHCNSLLKSKKRAAIINKAAENEYLDYENAEKRKIEYSYFIKLEAGALFIENKNVYQDIELEIFDIVLKNVGIVLQNCIYQERLSTLAMRDNLTGMYNRNYMNEHINKIMEEDKKLVLAIMDIDHFKNVNDTYGHDFGDLVLKEGSKFLKNNISNQDEIYRWGGEEFIISFPNQGIEEVNYKLNNIREDLSKLKISDGIKTISITASFGIAAYRKGLDLEHLIVNCDRALYESKETGRNKITIYKEEH